MGSPDMRCILMLVLAVLPAASLPAVQSRPPGGDAAAHAIEGRWKQSGWKACDATARLSADALDVPVDDLVFRADGTFSATWQGSGASKLGDPAVRFEDLRGTYTLDASTGGIHLRPAPGVTPPRDFAGDGTFAIEKDQLTLRKLWLGTRSAAARPPICELTFSKKPA